MQKKERICEACGRPLELVEIDRGEKIAWYTCPMYSQGRAEEAKGHTILCESLTDEIDKDLIERSR